MKPSRTWMAMAITGAIGLACGCDTIGGDRSVKGDTRGAALNDEAPPSTIAGSTSAGPSHSTGTWSSQSRNIEKGLLNREANSSW